MALGNAIIAQVKSLGIKAVLREATVPNTNYSSLGILREIDGADTAGVLIEMGSVSAINTKFLRTNADGIGKAIATGIANYLKVPTGKKATAPGEECEEETQILPVESKPVKTENKGKWHDPVDNPRCTLYMQNGGEIEPLGKIWGLFGKNIRKEVGRPHTGLDLFATTGKDIYACVDGTVYNRCWHGGYGNTVTIKVKDPKAFMALKRAYTKQTTREQDSGTYWSDKGDIYLFYAHLNSVKEFTFGQEVASGDILGTTGRSGVTAGTRAPHLHFEIFCDYQMPAGTNYRINPGFFVNYKTYEKQSAAERTEQKTEKDRGKIVGVNGVKKLAHHNEGKFQK